MDFILPYLVAKSSESHLILHLLNPTNMMYSSIWWLEAQRKMPYSGMLLSLPMDATLCSSDGGDVIPITTCKSWESLEVLGALWKEN